MLHQYSRQHILFDATSANSSTFTSNWNFMGDFAQISVSIITTNTAASLHTLQGSNDDGFTVAGVITNISTLSTIVAQGAYAVTPGIRWMRCQRSALDSQTSVIIQART